MQDLQVINILQNQLNYSARSISDIKIFINELLKANKKHNFISRSTENVIWHRHVLDSAQLVKFINFSKGSLSDLGSGAGFPGLILALFNNNKNFHVKLYEKSPVKRAFLMDISKKLSINVEILGNVYHDFSDTDYIVSRAFKKGKYDYKLENSITNKDSKIIIVDFKK
jgi:16S rRNA (guanine527-N7)-methyltransferase